MLTVLYEDEELIVVHKPHGLLVHKTSLAKDATEFAMQLVRNQIGQHVFPAHRLDRKTAGALLFAKTKEVNQSLQHLFQERKVLKKYHAIVRGYAPEYLEIDYALTENDKTQEAQTSLRRIKTFEIPIPFGGHDSSRYSLVELTPATGRFHQLRKHMAHIRHPIIGDRPHGCNKQNKLWKEIIDMPTMMLCATQLKFEHPINNTIDVSSDYSREMHSALEFLESH